MVRTSVHRHFRSSPATWMPRMRRGPLMHWALHKRLLRVTQFARASPPLLGTRITNNSQLFFLSRLRDRGLPGCSAYERPRDIFQRREEYGKYKEVLTNERPERNFARWKRLWERERERARLFSMRKSLRNRRRWPLIDLYLSDF